MADDKNKAKEDKKDSPKIQKEALPEIKPGMTVRVHQQITEKGPKGDKQRIQVFEGIVLATRGGSEIGATITVRKMSGKIGVEKVFPIYSPNVIKVETIKQAKVRQAKAYYLRDRKKKLKETKIQAK